MIFLIILVFIIGVTSITGYALTRGKAYLLYSLDDDNLKNKSTKLDTKDIINNVKDTTPKKEVELVTKFEEQESLNKEEEEILFDKDFDNEEDLILSSELSESTFSNSSNKGSCSIDDIFDDFEDDDYDDDYSSDGDTEELIGRFTRNTRLNS